MWGNIRQHCVHVGECFHLFNPAVLLGRAQNEAAIAQELREKAMAELEEREAAAAIRPQDPETGGKIAVTNCRYQIQHVYQIRPATIYSL